MRNKTEEELADEYRKKAQEHMEACVSSWKVFLKTGVFFIAAVCVIVGICLAWFVNNKDVRSDGMLVQGVADGDFELAAAGKLTDYGIWDDELLSQVLKGSEVTLEGKSYVSTATSRSSIRWAITDDSHMENQSYEGIRPGSYGKMVFYIIPNKSGELTVTLDVGVRGITSEEGIPLPEDAVDLLKGHVLLFAGYDQERQAYKGWISEDASSWEINLSYEESGYSEPGTATLSRTENGELVWEAQNVIGEHAYPVTIYWIWPEIVGEYIYKELTFTENRPILFLQDRSEQDVNNPFSPPGDLFAKMGRCEAGSLSNAYFKWAWANETNDQQDEKRQDFQHNITEASLNRLRNEKQDRIVYSKACEYYNCADQYLGESIRFVELCIDAR